MCKHSPSRRKFLRYATLGTCGSIVHQSFSPNFIARALAAPQHRAAYSSNPILVVVNLAGGASYQLAPIYASAWRDKNPTISYGPDDSHAVTASQGLHPSFDYLAQLFTDGDLAIVNQVGFPSHSRSHEDAARMWMTGSASPTNKPGVLNQMSCQLTGLFSSISLAGSDPLIEGSCPGARELESLATLNGTEFKSTDENEWVEMIRSNVLAGDTSALNATKAKIRSSIDTMESAADTIRGIASSSVPTPVAFPNSSFGRDCLDVARLIQASSVIGAHAFYLEKGGFDTHSNERGSMPNNLNDVDNSLQALIESIKVMGRFNDLTVVIWSEFTRTFENGSEGTDHGNQGPVFIMGGRVNGGRLVSPTPSNSEILSAGSFLRTMQVDSRNFWDQVIGANGMGFNTASILTESFDRTNLSLFV
ncbi:MAG: DUF1501 domain-containing protein [Bdellovibrionales bacterium]|nr:DUF1501 domain-containing protein [Bdellovibrionales bacterium]